jgi:hypothetical protein
VSVCVYTIVYTSLTSALVWVCVVYGYVLLLCVIYVVSENVWCMGV